MARLAVLALAALVCTAALASVAADPEIVMQFKHPIDFQWESAAARLAALTSGAYNESAVIITGIKVWKDQVFLSVPRLFKGVPSTLNVVDGSRSWAGEQPKLKPWPSWAWQNASDCSKLQFVMAVEIDPLDRMWVINTGNIDTFGTKISACPASLFVFNVTNGQLITQYVFPEAVVSAYNNFLNDIVVDPVNDWAYISDNNVVPSDIQGAIVSVNPFKNISTRSAGPSGNPEPEASVYALNGKRRKFNNALNSIALDPTGSYVFYAANTGFTVYMISTDVLRNVSLTPAQREAKRIVVGRKPSQSASFMFSSNGTLFMSALVMDALIGWNWGYGSLDDTWWTVYQNHETFLFPDQFTFDKPGYNTEFATGSNMWVLCDMLSDWLYDRLIDPNIWTVRVFKTAINTTGYMDGIMQKRTFPYYPITYHPTGTFGSLASSKSTSGSPSPGPAPVPASQQSTSGASLTTGMRVVASLCSALAVLLVLVC